MPIIETINLCKEYGDLVALNNLNLSIEAGDCFGFIGPNGAGKTTTIKILATLLKPTRGQAMVDGLTGVFNRRWLDEKLPRFVRRYRVGQQPLGLLLLDIDHFKRFNDDHGHAAGDRVLKVVADEMGNRLRPDDFRARYGGEEFVVILPNSDLAGSVSAAQRLRHAVKKLRVEGEDGKVLPPITVSIGAAVLAPTESAEALLARADAALYRAKDGGRDAVIVAKDEPVEATG